MAIDRKKVIEDLSKLTVMGDQHGLILGFGVLVNQLPAGFWNVFADKLTRSVPEDMYPTAAALLVNAAHECGYHTGYGIITSEEWNAVVAPMVKDAPKDVLEGAFAVTAAFGWARAEIVELEAGKRMVVRAYDYYEADVVRYGRAPKPTAHMLQGICAAFMDLAYGEPYPKGIKTFQCMQDKGLECGDDYGQFIVTRA